MKEYLNENFLKLKKDAFKLAFRISKNKQDSEDIVQDAFLKAFKNIDSFRGNCKFSTWFYRIVYNTAISYKSKYNRICFYPEDELEKKICITENGYFEYLKEVINLLTEDEVNLIKLFYNDGYSVKEIADDMNISESNVKIKLLRVRNKIKIFVGI